MTAREIMGLFDMEVLKFQGNILFLVLAFTNVCLIFPYWKATEDIQATAKRWSDELTGLGYTITSVPSIFDQQAAKLHFENAAKKEKEEKRQAEEVERQKVVAEKAEAEKQARIDRLDPKPKPPEWYAKLQASKQYWNGKFYGDDKRGWRIYLDGTEVKVAVEDKEHYENWNAELKEWHEFWRN